MNRFFEWLKSLPDFLKIALAVLLLSGIGGVIKASNETGLNWTATGSNLQVTQPTNSTGTPLSMNFKVGVGTPSPALTANHGDAYITGDLQVAGATRLNTVTSVSQSLAITGTLSVTGASTLTGNVTMGGSLVQPYTAVSVTSPTKTVSIAGRRFIVVTTNVAQTGALLSAGTQGQTVTIIGTSDTNTMTFTDGTSYTMAGNMALGAGDTLTFVCNNAHGNAYTELGRSNN